MKLVPDLECEMGVRLCADAKRLSVVVRPRYTLNDRRQGLVGREIEKDVARARSQFDESTRDLANAKAQLEAVQKELNRLSQTTPGSREEYALLQVRMGNLRQMGSKSEATVRRIAPLLPKISSNIERLELILTLVGEMSNGLRLHFRVVVRGKLGELVLVETASHDQPPLQ